jgi:hypothetical protein
MCRRVWEFSREADWPGGFLHFEVSGAGLVGPRGKEQKDPQKELPNGSLAKNRESRLFVFSNQHKLSACHSFYCWL